MQKILITGATGFVGSEVAKFLFNKFPKSKITIVGRKIKKWNHKIVKEKIILVDLFKDNLEKLGNFDYIIHCASILDNSDIDYSWNDYYDNNVFVINKILNTIKFKKLIYISSGSIFSSNKSIPEPNNSYGLSKYIAEKILEFYSLKKIKQIIIIRFPIIMGVNSRNNIVDDFAKSIIKNVDIEIYGNGELKRNIIHIDEVVKIISNICFKTKFDKIFEVFNAGSSRSMTISQIALLIKKILKSNTKIIRIDKKRRANYDSIINVKKIQKIIDFKLITTQKSVTKLISQKYL